MGARHASGALSSVPDDINIPGGVYRLYIGPLQLSRRPSHPELNSPGPAVPQKRTKRRRWAHAPTESLLGHSPGRHSAHGLTSRSPQFTRPLWAQPRPRSSGSSQMRPTLPQRDRDVASHAGWQDPGDCRLHGRRLVQSSRRSALDRHGAISLKSKEQSCVAVSSTAAECMAPGKLAEDLATSRHRLTYGTQEGLAGQRRGGRCPWIASAPGRPGLCIGDAVSAEEGHPGRGNAYRVQGRARWIGQGWESQGGTGEAGKSRKVSTVQPTTGERHGRW